jgi:hypothetical protein
MPANVTGLRLQANTTPGSFGYTSTPVPTATGPTPVATRTPTPTISGSGSIAFQVNVTPTAVDNSAPYQNTGLLVPGSYSGNVVPFMEANAAGIALSPRPFNFVIASPTFTPTPTATPNIAVFALANPSLTPFMILLPATGTVTPVQVNATGVRVIAFTTPNNLAPGGVIFSVNGTRSADTIAPYNIGPTLAPGTYQIAAIPYRQPITTNATPGPTGQIFVQIITPTPTTVPVVTSFSYSNLSQTPITPGPNNSFNLALLPANARGVVVQANTFPTPLGPTTTGTPGTPTGRVQFFGTAVAGVDNVAPYQSTPGTYSIMAIPYNQPGVTGTPGIGFSSNLILVNQTPTPTFIPSLTPSPTAPFCPAGGSLQALSGTTTPCPTPDLLLECQSNVTQDVSDQLELFGIVLENQTTWSLAEIQQLCLGVVKTGQALQRQYGGSQPDHTFRRVLIAPGRSQIAFARVLTGQPFCVTDNNVAAPLQSRVTCFGPQPPQSNALQFVQYTAVHELGHVFVGRTGGFQAGSTYFGLIDVPPLTNAIATGTIVADPVLRDNLNQPVMGAFIDANDNTDWVRGGRGWGSPASTPPVAPCNFQQNAFTVTDVNASPDDKSRERDEAAADMFLNWVYSEIGEDGFTDNDWRNISNCSATPPPTPTGTPPAPGAARYNYMETVVFPTLATLFPTMTSTP